MVAGDHLDPDAGGVTGLHRGDGLGPGRVQHAGQAQENQAPLQPLRAERLVGGKAGMGQGQHAHALPGQVPGLRLDGIPGQGRFPPRPVEHGGAGRQQAFQGAFHVDQAVALDLVHGRHGLAGGVEGQLVQAGEYGAQGGFIQPGLAGGHQQGGFGGVAGDAPMVSVPAQAGVVAQHAGQQGLAQGAFQADAFRQAHVAFQPVALPAHRVAAAARPQGANGHGVLGEGAGLVGADHRGAAQGLHRRQFADDGPAFGHARHADGQGDGDGRRQALGNGAHRQGHRRHEHGVGRLAAQHADGEGQRRESQDDDQQAPGEHPHLAGEGGAQAGRRGDQAGDMAGLGGIAGGDDQAVALAGGHVGAGVGHVAPVRQGGIGRHDQGGLLVRRQGFAGQGRFHQAQFLAVHQAQVGGHLVAGAEPHHVPRHQPDRVHAPPLPLAQHRDFRGHRPRQGRQGGFRPAFLDEAHQGIDQHHAEDDPGIRPFPQEGGHQAGHHQHRHQGLRHLVEQARERAAGRARAGPVRAVMGQAPGRVALRQPEGRVHIQAPRRLGGAEGMPVRACMGHGGYQKKQATGVA
jgi:hypothetical protein